MIVAAYLMGDGAYLHRLIDPATPEDPPTLQVVHVPLTHPFWMQAAEALRHFASSDEPLPDLAE